ncbi:hypothetical protein [Pseudomonas sp. FEN]|nr:hypothetical protein [Pseudomonas sp. FEN]CAD5199965.1 hypothetical protein [Pseudomonas sp. FEN]
MAEVASWQVAYIGIGSDTEKFVGLLDGWIDFSVTTLKELNSH